MILYILHIIEDRKTFYHNFKSYYSYKKMKIRYIFNKKIIFCDFGDFRQNYYSIKNVCGFII